MIRWKQAVESSSDFGMAFNNPDFVPRRMARRNESQRCQ